MKFLVSETQFKKVISKVKAEMEDYLLNEGVNEDRALKILKDNKIENPEEILDFLSEKDKSKNHKMLPSIVAFYISASNNEEFDAVIKTFQRLFNLTDKEGKPIQAPDVTFENNKIKILNNFFEPNEFSEFKNFIDHYYFVDDKTDEISKDLFETDANKKFENDNFIIYEAPTPHV